VNKIFASSCTSALPGVATAIIVPLLNNLIVFGRFIVTLLVGGDAAPVAVSTVNETGIGCHSPPVKPKKSPFVAPAKSTSPIQSKVA
jgi:hypothetical protein